MAGSSGSSLMTGLALAGLVLMVALLALVWKKRRPSWSRGEAGAELQEQGNLGQELQEMVDRADSNGDSQVTPDDFYNIMTKKTFV